MEKSPARRVLIVDQEPGIIATLQHLLNGAGYRTYSSGDGNEALDLIYSEPPDLILIARDLPGLGGDGVCRELKKENIFGHLPLLLMLSEGADPAGIDWSEVQADDVLVKPFKSEEVLMRVSLAFSRISRSLDANPLTRLPGNQSILKEVQRYLDGNLPFAVGYADLDYFKAFNDKYGFSRGDEVIRMTARVITNGVREHTPEGSFVGHVGGDDFVFLVPPDSVDCVCEEILKNFDLIVTTFYDEEDRMKRKIETVDRQGNPATFPIMSLSIAVVTNERRVFAHFGEISAIAAEVKKFVKGKKGSNYFKDRRTE
ncbi:MAG: response regulator [Deltaproteobacteria bacterium]|nr:response regulator [Deltaproteobacteria bacterium]